MQSQMEKMDGHEYRALGIIQLQTTKPRPQNHMGHILCNGPMVGGGP